jgi:hypothetical protein
MAFVPGCIGFELGHANTATDKQIYIQGIYSVVCGKCIVIYLYIPDG